MPELPKTLYLCDPLKNRDCKGNGKPHCGQTCFCTTNPDLALIPAVALTKEQYDEEYNKRNG